MMGELTFKLVNMRHTTADLRHTTVNLRQVFLLFPILSPRSTDKVRKVIFVELLLKRYV
jgi:hypothetical protein